MRISRQTPRAVSEAVSGVRNATPATLQLAIALMMVATSVLAGDAATAELPPVAPKGSVWSSGAGFDFDTERNKTRRSVSGIACPKDVDASGQRTCLFAFDEGVEARLAVVAPDGISPLPERIVLGSGGGELDAEGAALDGDFFYVTGSHSAKRSSCASNTASRSVVRFRRDPETGGAARDPSGRIKGFAESGTRLWDVMRGLPDLAPYTGERKCLGTEAPEGEPGLKGLRGVNIEGLAARKGRLSFGFRGPAIGERAPILEVDAGGLFEGGPINPHVTQIEVGPGRGIRDLHATEDGLIILAGPDDDKANADAGWLLGVWTGQANDGVGRPTWLARLKLDDLVRSKCDKEIKPEAITLLDQDATNLRVLVLSDGMCDGGPLLFDIPLRK
jgi:hypothetical protein